LGSLQGLEQGLHCCHIERSRDISGRLFLDVERFDSLTSRSLSLWPSRLSRYFSKRSVLHFGRNDRAWWREAAPSVLRPWPLNLQSRAPSYLNASGIETNALFLTTRWA
jgi:hypothetical protein